MEVVGHGTIQSGKIVLSDPLQLPEGTEGVVRIEPVVSAQTPTEKTNGFNELPFFGMWASRDDMVDSGEWVTKERDKWRHRLRPRD